MNGVGVREGHHAAGAGRIKMANTTSDSATLPLTERNFSEMVAATPRLLVDFWAPWCGPCRAVAPVLEELARAEAGRLVVAKVNVDEQPSLAQRYGVQAIPTLLFFKDGRVVDTVVGAPPKAELLRRLTALA
jgi:thioredoxin